MTNVLTQQLQKTYQTITKYRSYIYNIGVHYSYYGKPSLLYYNAYNAIQEGDHHAIYVGKNS